MCEVVSHIVFKWESGKKKTILVSYQVRYRPTPSVHYYFSYSRFENPRTSFNNRLSNMHPNHKDVLFRTMKLQINTRFNIGMVCNQVMILPLGHHNDELFMFP